MNNLLKIEQVRDLIEASACPSEAVESIEQFLASNKCTHDALHATIWLLVINHYKLRLKRDT